MELRNFRSLSFSTEGATYINEAQRRNPLTFAGVPQNGQPISAAGEPKFTVLRGHVEDVAV